MLHVSVPATLANVGPGFDVLGMAVGLYNHFGFEPSDTWRVEERAVQPREHLALWTAVRAVQHFGGSLSPLRITVNEGVPRARGLGSSATVRVGGLMAGLHFSGVQIPRADQLAFLSAEEGHPDNAVPAAVGGLTLCSQRDGSLHTERFDAPDLQVALCIPSHEVATDAARALLPGSVPLADAVFNVSAVSMLLAGLIGGRPEALRLGLADRLHQPLIGPVDQAFEAAVAAGAYGAVVSGSGSTLAALVPNHVDVNSVAEAMAKPFRAQGSACRCVATRPVNQGAFTGLE